MIMEITEIFFVLQKNMWNLKIFAGKYAVHYYSSSKYII